MSLYHISEIHPNDHRAQRQVDALLQKEGLVRDARLEEIIGVLNEDNALVATGSLFKNTLRCIAVDEAHKGEGLLATLMTALLERQLVRGFSHVFLYTKPESARYFAGLGFHEIARVADRLVFMENRKGAFAAYIARLPKCQCHNRTAAIVMNANPFTRGHQYLLNRAAAENDVVRCFVVSEDVSLVPFAARMKLVKAGCAHLPNVTVHPSGSYMVSNATFPSYFLKEDRIVTETQARLDVEVFARIAVAMGITRRYIGEEPFSEITRVYNVVMLSALPFQGIECVLLPRLAEGDLAISASKVRQMLHDGTLEAIRPFVPETTYTYFLSDEGKQTIKTIQCADNVQHD